MKFLNIGVYILRDFVPDTAKATIRRKIFPRHQLRVTITHDGTEERHAVYHAPIGTLVVYHAMAQGPR